MLQVYDISRQCPADSAVRLGYFDGVHIAHQSLIGQMCSYADRRRLAKSVFTFTKKVSLGHKGKDIFTRRQKTAAMEKLGVEVFYSPDFSDFANLSPREFVRDILAKNMKAKAVFCGENFFFGKNRAGNVQVLKELCREYSIDFFQAETVFSDGEMVSSTRIRNLLREGDIERANIMLGAPYSVNFSVVHGKKIGRTIGTPTINQIYPEGMCTPKEGVYITCTTVDGVKYPSATGFGSRPTVNGTNQTCETYILGFDGDLYGQNIQVEFYSYLYPTRKFDSLQQLGEMIQNSALKAKDYLEKKGVL